MLPTGPLTLCILIFQWVVFIDLYNTNLRVRGGPVFRSLDWLEAFPGWLLTRLVGVSVRVYGGPVFLVFCSLDWLANFPGWLLTRVVGVSVRAHGGQVVLGPRAVDWLVTFPGWLLTRLVGLSRILGTHAALHWYDRIATGVVTACVTFLAWGTLPQNRKRISPCRDRFFSAGVSGLNNFSVHFSPNLKLV